MSQKQRNESSVYRLLNRAGPQTVEELGRHPSPDERRVYAVRSFNPMPATTRVWHLARHDPRRVVRRWLAVNRSTLRQQDVSQRTLSTRLSGSHRAAWDEMKTADQYDWLQHDYDGGDQPDEKQAISCPNCGEPQKDLPAHLPGCDG